MSAATDAGGGARPARTLLVIPAYREGARLPPFLERLCRAVERSGLPVEIRTVDDGSGEAEAEAMAAAVAKLRPAFTCLGEPIYLPENVGKGGAVYAGWDSGDPGEFGWLAFVDADGAVSAGETLRLLAEAAARDPAGRDCLFAVRQHGGDTEVHRTPLRKFLGNAFRLLVRIGFSIPCSDTQCGLKCIPAASYREVRPHLVERRFVFDVELAARLTRAGHRITEFPIAWEESLGTSLNIRSALGMLFALVAVRWRLFRRR